MRAHARHTCSVDIRGIAPASEAIAQVTSDIAGAVRAAWTAGRAAHVVLSGGRSGAALGAGIRQEFSGGLSGTLHIWIADERFVEYADADRNDTAIVEALDSHTASLLVHRHLPPSRATLGEIVIDYTDQLVATLGDAPFDAVVLSVGEDGHVASVFPGHPQFEAPAYAESASPKPPSHRTTISLRRLANTRQCTLLVLGESKRDALTRIAAADQTLPAVQLTAMTGAIVITDVTLGMPTNDTDVVPS